MTATVDSAPAAVPAGWRLTVATPTTPAPPGALRLSLAGLRVAAESTSMAFWRRRLAAFEGAREWPLGEVEILVHELPTLDELWTLYLMAWQETGRELPDAFEAMCHYAEDVRQGHWPDRVPPEQSIQAIYLAMAQELLMRDPPDRPRFLHEAFRLFDRISQRLLDGARLLDEPLLAGEPAFERYSAMLVRDAELYREDRARGRRYLARLPAAHSPTRTERELPLLVLSRPVATQFKLWARRDVEAPGRSGYPLLLVEQANGAFVLSADPASKVKVGWLAAALSKAEERARRQPAPWYDGRDHAGTLVAAPKDGSRLDTVAVLRVLGRALRLSRVGTRRRLLVASAAVGLCLAVVLGWGLRVTTVPRPGSPTDELAEPPGAKGEPLPRAQVLNLLAQDDGPRSFAPFALVAGVCSYTAPRELKSPCRDARAVRELLIRHYGYPEKNILFFVDRPLPGERTDGPPTAANLRMAIERFRERFGNHERSSFLFYYSGHGGYEKGARKDFGVLQPTGYFERGDLPISDRGWDMQELVDGIRKGVPSRHVMVVLDACYSGWAVGAKGDERLRADLMSLWSERAEVVLSAGTKGQRAWEDEDDAKAWAWDGHSAFTAFLLQGLTPRRQGTPADLNADGVVTDEELARFLRSRVPASVREVKRSDQTPQFFRFDEHLPRSGQFLFVAGGAPP